MLITKHNTKAFLKGRQYSSEIMEREEILQGDEKEIYEGAEIIRVSRGEVRPRLDVENCAICGRTILTGETTELYRLPQSGERPVIVCSICRPKAKDDGLSKVA